MRKRNRIETGRENKKWISLTITSDVFKVCWSHCKCCHVTGILSVVSSLLIHLLLKVESWFTDPFPYQSVSLEYILKIRPWQSVRCSMSLPIFHIRLWVVLWQNHNLKTFPTFLGAVLIKCYSDIKVREWASTKSSLLLQDVGRDTKEKCVGHAFRDYRLPYW